MNANNDVVERRNKLNKELKAERMKKKKLAREEWQEILDMMNSDEFTSKMPSEVVPIMHWSKIAGALTS